MWGGGAADTKKSTWECENWGAGIHWRTLRPGKRRKEWSQPGARVGNPGSPSLSYALEDGISLVTQACLKRELCWVRTAKTSLWKHKVTDVSRGKAVLSRLFSLRGACALGQDSMEYKVLWGDKELINFRAFVLKNKVCDWERAWLD